MALYLNGKVERIALSGKREIQDTMPWHFTPIKIPGEGDITKIRHWIWKNLDGRFAVTMTQGENWQTNYVIGFEDPTEASAFMISLPLMLEHDDWILA